MKREWVYPYILGFLVSFIVGLAQASTLSAVSSAASCEFLINGVPEERPNVNNRLRTEMNVQQYYESSPEYSVSLNPIFDGDMFLISRKPGESWFSPDTSETKSEEAIQGDPRWNFLVMGPQTLKYFGIQSFDGEHLIYPSVEKMEKLLKDLNEQLAASFHPRISVHFYKQESVSLSEYFTKFIENRGLPMANPEHSPMHFVHDLALHLSAISLPEEYTNVLEQRVRVFLEFEEYLEKKYAATGFPETYKDLLKGKRRLLAKDLDGATASGVLLEVGKTQRELSDLIQDVLGSFMGTYDLVYQLSFGQKGSSLYNDAIEFLSQDEVQNSFKDLLDDQRFNELWDHNRLENAFQRRRLEIEMAAAVLNQRP